MAPMNQVVPLQSAVDVPLFEISDPQVYYMLSKAISCSHEKSFEGLTSSIGDLSKEIKMLAKVSTQHACFSSRRWNLYEDATTCSL